MGEFTSCPLCNGTDFKCVLTLGNMPLVNSINDSVNKYPLNLYHCPECGLVFVNTPRTPDDIFSNYTYFSSWSRTWLKHCRSLYHDISNGSMVDKNSFIIEIASNDGYMLRNFVEDGYSHVLGIEPANNVAKAAQENGIPTLNEFFTENLAWELAADSTADCIIALNVLAHVPDISGFLMGIHTIMKDDGFAVFEFHHLMSLVSRIQFDTIYHEHFTYLSLNTIEYALGNLGMRIFNAEQVPTQGGSLRLYVSHDSEKCMMKYPAQNSVDTIRCKELDSGISSYETLLSFADSVNGNIVSARNFILKLSSDGKTLAGYGAAAKAVVFINALGLDENHIKCVADINPVKQGKNIPGTGIPVVSPAQLIDKNPDYVIIFPWNLKDEISSDLREKLTDETKFIVFTPEAEIFE